MDRPSIKQAAAIMNVSVRTVYLAIELQRCRPDLEPRLMSGELTLREALRIAKPDKYAKRDKVEQWAAQYRAWDETDRHRALQILVDILRAENV
jgi:hypothetical protein